MKKIFILICLTFLVISCSKKKIEGTRIPVFTHQDLLTSSDKKAEIKIPEKRSNKNHYGDSSVLNSKIENYSMDKNLEDKKVKIKKYKISYKATGQTYKVYSPLIVNQIIYTISPNGILYARDLNNPSEILWKNKLVKDKNLRDFSFAKIAYSNQRIIISTGYNEIASISANYGKVVWVKKLNAVPISYPVIYNGIIYVITNDNKLYALNEKNGEITWIHSGITKNTAILGSANPIIYKDLVFVSYSSGELYALKQSAGETVWSETLTSNVYNFTSFELTDIDATPIIKNDNIYAISNAGKLASMSAQTGRINWEKEFSSITNFWIADNFLYVINNDNILTCIEINSGSTQWVSALQKYRKPKKSKDLIVYKNITMANGKLILINNQNKLLIVSPLDGEVLKTIKLKHNIFDKPVFANGKMYLNATKEVKVKLLQI